MPVNSLASTVLDAQTMAAYFVSEKKAFARKGLDYMYQGTFKPKDFLSPAPRHQHLKKRITDGKSFAAAFTKDRMIMLEQALKGSVPSDDSSSEVTLSDTESEGLDPGEPLSPISCAFIWLPWLRAWFHGHTETVFFSALIYRRRT